MLSIIAYYHICHVNQAYRSFINSHKATSSICKAHNLCHSVMYVNTGVKAGSKTLPLQRERENLLPLRHTHLQRLKKNNI